MTKRAEHAQLEERLIAFAGRVLDLVEQLPQNPVAKHLSAQIMRSATSPALNYGEAQGAESRSDFVHKMKICVKELRETAVCLRLIQDRHWHAIERFDPLLQENNELIAIFVSSIKTALKNT